MLHSCAMCMAHASPTSSTPRASSAHNTGGKSSGAAHVSTKSDSAALQTPGREVFALTTTETAFEMSSLLESDL